MSTAVLGSRIIASRGCIMEHKSGRRRNGGCLTPPPVSSPKPQPSSRQYSTFLSSSQAEERPIVVVATREFEQIPGAMRQYPQFVLWRWEERDGKRTKVPVRPQGRLDRARADDLSTAGSFAGA